MTLNKRDLKKLGESMWVWFTKEQERIILDRLGTEPEPYEWSEQDIVEQIRHICFEHPRPKPKDPPWMTNTAAVNGKSSVGQPEVQHRATENTALGNPNARRTQVKISVAPELASAFKAACAASNVSMAETLSGFMAKYTNTVVKRKPEYTTKRQRRAAIQAMMRQLGRIKDAEERYRDAIPDNLLGSVVFENAEQSVLLLDEAIDLLGSIY